MLCILGAVEEELSFFLSNFSFKHFPLGKKSIWLNKKNNLLIAQTGAGIINATYLTSLILENYPIKVVFLIGCGGTFPNKGIKLGDIVLANEEIWVDACGYLPNRFYLISPLIEKLKKIIPDLLDNKISFKTGSFLTVSATTDNKEKLLFLEKKFPKAICENMEGAAVAYICQIYNIPFIELRGISNFLTDKREKWEIELATIHVQKLLLKLLERKSKWY
ncbi:MAG: hypothetical protein LWW95_07005 [Candidatus Desulfofervidus auxilii]|nr:hypothetical protein [Candidatus Desulfofervidus auxilii]